MNLSFIKIFFIFIFAASFISLGGGYDSEVKQLSVPAGDIDYLIAQKIINGEGVIIADQKGISQPIGFVFHNANPIQLSRYFHNKC